MRQAKELLDNMIAGERAIQTRLRGHRQHPRPGAVCYVYVVGEVTVGMAGAIINELHRNARAETVYVDIDSLGGSVHEMMRIHAALTAHCGRKVAYVRRAVSAAFVIMLSCRERIGYLGSRLLHHSTTHGSTGKRTVSTVRTDQLIDELIERRCGRRDGRLISEALRREGDGLLPMGAGKAFALGLLTDLRLDIREPRPGKRWRAMVDRIDGRLTRPKRRPADPIVVPSRRPGRGGLTSIDDRAGTRFDPYMRRWQNGA